MYPPGGEFHNGCGTLGSRLENESPDHNFGTLLLSHCMPTCLQSHHHLPGHTINMQLQPGVEYDTKQPHLQSKSHTQLYIYKRVAGAITKNVSRLELGISVGRPFFTLWTTSSSRSRSRSKRKIGMVPVLGPVLKNKHSAFGLGIQTRFQFGFR
jgi:hypothetical protein